MRFFSHSLVVALALSLIAAVGLGSPLDSWVASVNAKIDENVEVDSERLLMRTTGPVQQGQELITLPGHLVFSKYLENDDPAIEFLVKRSGAETVDDRVHLVMSLLREMRNRMSPWAGWLSSLPEKLTTPLFFSDEDLDVLQHHDAHGRVVAYRKSIDSTWETLIKNVVESGVSLEQFKFAFALVSGRRTILEVSDEKRVFALMPLINYARHSNTPNAEVRVKLLQEDKESTDVFDPGVASFVLLAKSDLPAGVEVSLQYGFADNYEGFLAQGVVQDNPDLDSLTFVVEEPLEELKEALTAVGVERYEFKLTPNSISVTLLQYLRVKNGANSGDEEIAAALKKGQGISMDNDRLALGELMQTIKAVQKQWDASVEQDLVALDTEELSANQQLALIYRMREKLILAGVETLVKELWSLWLQ